MIRSRVSQWLASARCAPSQALASSLRSYGTHSAAKKESDEDVCSHQHNGRHAEDPLPHHLHSKAELRKRYVPMYNFERFTREYMNNKPIRWPVGDEMQIAPFRRPDPDQTDEEIFAEQAAQTKTSLSNIQSLLPDEIVPGMTGEAFERTRHADHLFIGFAHHPQTGKVERYLLKVFSPSETQLRQARREVLFSYLFVEAGQAEHAPKIGLIKQGNLYILMRRFYKGQDGRFLLENSKHLPHVENRSLVKNFALRYVLFADLDLNNPGNIIFTRHSALTPKVILNIDGEDIIADSLSMTQYRDSKWRPGDPIPGSHEWRLKKSEELGPWEFFKRQALSENAMLAFLRAKGLSVESMSKETIANFVIDQALAARPYFEQLVRSFGIAELKDLQEGTVTFQLVLDAWEKRRKLERPISLFELATGMYDTH